MASTLVHRTKKRPIYRGVRVTEQHVSYRGHYDRVGGRKLREEHIYRGVPRIIKDDPECDER